MLMVVDVSHSSPAPNKKIVISLHKQLRQERESKLLEG